MISTSPTVTPDELAAATGWSIKPQGACKDEACVPLRREVTRDGRVELDAFAECLRMPLIHDAEHGLWALGPESLGGRALTTATAPELVLPDFDGRQFALSSLRGQKVVVLAWASW